MSHKIFNNNRRKVGLVPKFSIFLVESVYNVIRSEQLIQWRDFFNKLTFYFIIDNDLPKQDDLLRSEQSGKSFYFTNMPDDLVHEPARPDRNVFQTLISQELLEQDGSKFNRIYRHVGTEGGWGGEPPPPNNRR